MRLGKGTSKCSSLEEGQGVDFWGWAQPDPSLLPCLQRRKLGKAAVAFPSLSLAPLSSTVPGESVIPKVSIPLVCGAFGDTWSFPGSTKPCPPCRSLSLIAPHFPARNR